jgi:hypothetical protein
MLRSYVFSYSYSIDPSDTESVCLVIPIRFSSESIALPATIDRERGAQGHLAISQFGRMT